MNFIPVFLICFVIFVLWMFYEQRKSQNKDKEASDAFWERERMANQTRKKDISHLPILHVEESELPVFTTENESVLYYIDHIRKIIKSPMLDSIRIFEYRFKISIWRRKFQGFMRI